jgi:DNA-binding beta-propeller fold protein YncE
MVVVSPDGRNAYSADDFGSAVSAFRRDPATGALTQLPGADACIKDGPNAPAYTHCPSTADSLNGAFSVAISPDGANAYVAADGGGAITAFSRDPATGALHRLPGAAACIRNNDAPQSTKCDVTGNGLLGAEMATVSPDGHTVYVAAFHGMAVSAFSRDETSGALTQLPGAAGCVEDLRAEKNSTTRCQARTDGLYQPRIVAISPDGANAYVPTSVGSTLAVLSLTTKGSPLRFTPAAHHARANGGANVLREVGIAALAVLVLGGAALIAKKQYRGAQRRRLQRYQGAHRR